MVKVARIVNVFFNSNTFVIYNDNQRGVYLIDPGNFVEIKKWMIGHNKTNVKGIFITHAHFDHICAINELLQEDSEIPLYLSSHDGKIIIEDAKRNYSKYHETPYVVKAKQFIEIKEKQEIKLWDKIILIIYDTPGHSVDSISMICDNYIFTGDAFIPEVKVVTKTKGGDKAIAQLSIEKIWRLLAYYPVTYVCPGHNEIKSVELLNKGFRYV